MEAKDTVKKPIQLCTLVCFEHRTQTLESKDCTGFDCEDCQLEAQAEITWKAAVREVVEWIEGNIYKEITFDPDVKAYYISDKRWQAKKKEWGK